MTWSTRENCSEAKRTHGFRAIFIFLIHLHHFLTSLLGARGKPSTFVYRAGWLVEPLSLLSYAPWCFHAFWLLYKSRNRLVRPQHDQKMSKRHFLWPSSNRSENHPPTIWNLVISHSMENQDSSKIHELIRFLGPRIQGPIKSMKPEKSQNPRTDLI